MLIQRSAGSKSGNTYHEGVSPLVNPKIFILLQGEVEFSWRHIEAAEYEMAKVSAPAKIVIQPLVTHAMQAVTDILVLECNGLKDVENDRHYLEVECTI